MSRAWTALVVGAAAAIAAVVFAAWPERRGAATGVATRATRGEAALPRNAETLDTAHYRIHSGATREQTAQVARAVEALYARYVAEFPPARQPAAPLALVLYRDRAEFKRNNRSRPWAEAYYLPPRSYAYFDASARNPYHWMVHEATHQLMREVSGFPRAKWIDEGVATYFSASRFVDGELRLGDPDPDAYPVWWLPQFRPGGVLEDDLAAGRVIPLEQIITGQGGPDINRHFNQYYIHYWSLSHFLFHYRDGVYAERYRRLIAAGGSLEDFERLIGPVGRIQREWYAHLQTLSPAQGEAAGQAER